MSDLGKKLEYDENDPVHREEVQMFDNAVLKGKIRVAEANRDEWKRRAIEAEKALQKAADIFGDMIEYGRIDTESTPYSYYVPEDVLEQIYAPLQNVLQSDKKATA